MTTIAGSLVYIEGSPMLNRFSAAKKLFSQHWSPNWRFSEIWGSIYWIYSSHRDPKKAVFVDLLCRL